MTEAAWDRVIDINLKGAFLCTQAAAKVMMKQRSGCIINIASVVGAMGNAGQANYVASKAGLIGLTKSAAKELAARGIRVNAIAPGFIDTEMTENLSEKVKEALLEQIPFKKMGQPEDVAGVAAFLASEEASYITGQVIHVNGGMYM
jgi:3-oxoacyl-[acyl-carrier protein] reductase